MDQWQSYSESPGAGSSRRYNGNGQIVGRDYNNGQPQTQQQQPPAGFKYDQYQGGLNSQQNPAASPITTPQLRDGNGDVVMPDANDPYSSMKQYPMRPHQPPHLASNRPSALHSPQEPSAAAQRYSPMEVLSPTSPYAPKPGGASHFSQSPSQRQSPTRTNDYAAQSSYYADRQQPPQLPPINPYAPSGQDSYPTSAVSSQDNAFATDPKSPRRMATQTAVAPPNKGPVPEFKKLRALADLRPKVNTQPAFRRANPEGGFISVSASIFFPSFFLARTFLFRSSPLPAPTGSHRGLLKQMLYPSPCNL